VFEFGAPVTAIDPSVPTAICTNAPTAARLLLPHAPNVAAALARIRMTSLLTVTTFFRASADDLHGFGVLFPRSSSIRALGVLFNTDIFRGRSAWRSETWIYGAVSADDLPDTQAAPSAVLADRAVLTGRRDAPIASYVTPQIAALPIYDLAVADAIRAMGAHQLPPTLAVTGNYLGRLGVSRLLDGAAEAAGRLLRRATA
jgi:oxygen-dependent protoporphyrinogen oxidase